MAIPLIIGGLVAVATGALGAGAMISAKEKGDKARGIYESKEKQQNNAASKLELVQAESSERAEQLGLLKLQVQNGEIAEFIKLYERLGQLNIKVSQADTSVDFTFTPEEIRTMKKVSMNAGEVLSAGAQSLAGGVLAGAGVYSSVMAFGAASTGTAISTLSGAAATNATMAWLGGGSLASGGMGMAGGAAALGLWVAGPAILITGIIADSKADEALTEAERYGAKVDVACEEMKTQRALLKAVSTRCLEFDAVISELRVRISPELAKLSVVLDNLNGRTDLNDDETETLHKVFSLAKTLKDVMNINILDDDGDLTDESEDAQQYLESA